MCNFTSDNGKHLYAPTLTTFRDEPVGPVGTMDAASKVSVVMASVAMYESRQMQADTAHMQDLQDCDGLAATRVELIV